MHARNRTLDTGLEDAAIGCTALALAAPALLEFLARGAVAIGSPARVPLLLHMGWFIVPFLLAIVAIATPMKGKGLLVLLLSLYLGIFTIRNSFGLVPWKGTFSQWFESQEPYLLPMMVAAILSLPLGAWRWNHGPVPRGVVNVCLAMLLVTTIAMTIGVSNWPSTHREVPTRHIVLVASSILLGGAWLRTQLQR